MAWHGMELVLVLAGGADDAAPYRHPWTWLRNQDQEAVNPAPEDPTKTHTSYGTQIDMRRKKNEASQASIDGRATLTQLH